MELKASTVHGLTKTILAAEYDNPKPIPDFHPQMWELCCSNARYVAIAAPRAHAKSTAVTHAYTLASCLFRVSPFTVILSRTEDQASDFLNDIKIELLENESLRSQGALCPVKLLKEAQTEIIVQMSDGYVFKIIAIGIESFKRGLKWRKMRPKLILLDDVEGDESVLNRNRREKLSKVIDAAVIPSLADDGVLRMVGTIMHMDSYLENRMPDVKDSRCVVSELSEILIPDIPDELKDDNADWASARFKAHNEDFSEILWPEKFSERRLRAIRKDYVERGYPEVYAQEYLNYPIDDSTSYFRMDDFIPMSDEDREKRKNYYIGVDPAISLEQRADFTVISVVGVDEDGVMHVVDMRRGRFDAKEIIDEIFSVYKRYSPEMVIIEGGMIEKAIRPSLNDEMIKRNQYLPLPDKAPNPSKDKRTRNKPLQHRMRAGGVRFNDTADWYPDCEAEMKRFDKDVHDDVVDSLGLIAMWVDKLIAAPTDEEFLEDEYNDNFGSFYVGRSKITGY